MSALRNANTTTNTASSAHISALEDNFNNLSLDRSPPSWSPHSCDLSNFSAQLSRSLIIDNDKNNDNNISSNNNNNNSTTQSAVHPIAPPPPQLRLLSQFMLPPIPSLSSLPPSASSLTLRSKTRPKANRAKVAKHRKDGKEGKAAAGVTKKKKKKREEEGGPLHNQGLNKSAIRRWIAEMRSQRRAREGVMSRARVNGDGGEDAAVD